MTRRNRKQPIRTLEDLRQYSKDIKNIVKTYRGRNVRVLNITPEGDLDLGEKRICLLIEFPTGILTGPEHRLENELFRLIDRDIAKGYLSLSNRIFVKVIIQEELLPDEFDEMKARAVPL